MRRNRAPLSEQLPSLRRIQAALASSVEQMASLGDLDESRFENLNDEERQRVDAFLKRFENGVEGGRRLFRGALELIGEHDPTLSVRDIQNKAEKFGLIMSAGEWRQAVDARNEVSHEYGMNFDQAAEAVARALEQARYVAGALAMAMDALEREPFADALRQRSE